MLTSINVKVYIVNLKCKKLTSITTKKVKVAKL